VNFQGILAGAASFVIIGLLHPVVIWAEYRFTKSCWWAFLVAGLLATGGSVFVDSVLISCVLAVLGFSLLWCIKELYEQEERVRKGWYPARC
jgi:ABC-type Co2+ transport system permease subunit